MYLRLILLSVFLCLIGCSSQRYLPEENYYDLPEISGVIKGKQLFNTVSVINFQASDLYKERAIVYTEDDITLKQYHYHHWIDSPARLLTERLAKTLRQENIAEYVLTTYEGNSELIIKGQIKSFTRVRSENRDSVRVNIFLQVNSSNKNSPILLKEYSETVFADEKSITNTINAFGKAVDIIFGRFQQDLRETVN